MNNGHQESRIVSDAFHAVSKGESSKIRRFIREGLNLDSEHRNENGFYETLLIHAIKHKKSAIARILIKNGANVNKTITFWDEYPYSRCTHYALQQAIWENLPKTVKDLLRFGAQFLRDDGYGGKKALYKNILHGDKARILEVLLDFDVDSEGFISMDMALKTLAPNILRLLFCRGFSFTKNTAVVFSQKTRWEKATSMDDICWLTSMGISLIDKAIAGQGALSNVSQYPTQYILDKYFFKIQRIRDILSEAEWPVVISDILMEFYIHEENLNKLKLKKFYKKFVYKYWRPTRR